MRTAFAGGRTLARGVHQGRGTAARARRRSEHRRAKLFVYHIDIFRGPSQGAPKNPYEYRSRYWKLSVEKLALSPARFPGGLVTEALGHVGGSGWPLSTGSGTGSDGAEETNTVTHGNWLVTIGRSPLL